MSRKFRLLLLLPLAALAFTACQPAKYAPPQPQDVQIALQRTGFKNVACSGTSKIRCSTNRGTMSGSVRSFSNGNGGTIQTLSGNAGNMYVSAYESGTRRVIVFSNTSGTQQPTYRYPAR